MPPMQASLSAKIRELCELPSEESDAQRLVELAREIIELYDREQARKAAESAAQDPT
jgi:hypothetical protein